MTEKIGVIGTPGKWSTEALADALEQRTGFRLVVDMSCVTLDLVSGALTCDGIDLASLDGLVIKKISEVYSPHALDRLEMLRVAEARGICAPVALRERDRQTLGLRQPRPPPNHVVAVRLESRGAYSNFLS